MQLEMIIYENQLITETELIDLISKYFEVSKDKITIKD